MVSGTKRQPSGCCSAPATAETAACERVRSTLDRLSQTHLAPKIFFKKKNRKERVHGEVFSKSVRLMSVVLTLSRTDHMTRPCTKGIWRKTFSSSRNSDKATFYIPGEVDGKSTPIASKRPEERDVVVDSEALMHMMNKKKN